MDAALALIQPTFAVRDPADAVLIARCQAGEREAFGVLLNRYRDRVVNLAYQLLRQRDDAEDVAQEAFIQAFTAIQSFRGEAQWFTWLYRITVNLCRHRQRRAKDVAPPRPVGVSERSETTDVESQALTKLMVERTLDKLSEPLRVVLILREMHDLSYEDIAEVLNIPIGTVRSRLNEARRKFREAWEKLG
ncbi:MAG: sigma-70 family RNA polymerase sigma factor [Abditibacteriales bacterium]|nr:sigma-70 family RNA polymerase sigma factor [Abditibacteriales bacterium]MDW8367978.1 sigma-70 family RNA polymerase sigma factor [Abditibacteriales bacterium]